jgi:hypothetical protein
MGARYALYRRVLAAAVIDNSVRRVGAMRETTKYRRVLGRIQQTGDEVSVLWEGALITDE